MKPLSLILKLCLFIISILLFSCNDDDSIIYFNSFENSSDLRGWDGLDKSSFADDVPNIFGGKKSVLISGGCVYPTSKYTISPRGDDAFIRVECFGKNLSFGGQIVLCLDEEYNTKPSITIENTSWTHYRSENVFYWPANSSLTICLNSGGFVGSSMLIDELKIEKAF